MIRDFEKNEPLFLRLPSPAKIAEPVCDFLHSDNPVTVVVYTEDYVPQGCDHKSERHDNLAHIAHSRCYRNTINLRPCTAGDEPSAQPVHNAHVGLRHPVIDHD